MEDEAAIEPGAVATCPDDEPDVPGDEPVFKPRDFRLNLQARLAEPAEPLSDLDSPAIRKLTWEHVVPDRPASSAPSAATIVPLPPPRRVVPPAPPQPAKPLEPPAVTAASVPDVETAVADLVVDDEVVADEILADVDDDGLVDDEIDAELDDDLDTDVDDQVVAAVAPSTASEVNRLALVPDLIDDDSPIELPAITPSGPIVAHAQSVYRPVLAETFYVPPPARPPTVTVAAMVADSKSPRRRAPGKPKRHLFRSFVTLVVLFGLLAGGAFAAKKYLLNQAEWTPEVKPLADQVAAARGLQFRIAVEVSPLPVGDYAKRLAGSIGDAAGRPRTSVASVGAAQR